MWTDLSLEISHLISLGEKNGLLLVSGDAIKYINADRKYKKTPEEIVRAALYVHLVINLHIPTDSIMIEHDRVDLSVQRSVGAFLYECKPYCTSKGDLLAASQQARANAIAKGFEKAFVTYNKENILNIQEVPLEFKPPQMEAVQHMKWPITISTINLKGGVGKTSLTCALAEFLCIEYHKRVLVVDLDPQTNATVVLMGEEKWKKERDDACLTLAHYFEERIKKPRDVVSLNPLDILVTKASNVGGGIDGLDMIPSSPHFIDIQEEIPSIPQKRYGAGSYVTVLHEFLQPIINKQNYDFILIDCPPSLGALTQNGLYISKYFLIPCVPDWLSTYGVPLILRQAWEFSKYHNKLVECLGVVFCRFRSQLPLHQRTVERYRSLQGRSVTSEQNGPKYPHVFETIIPETVKAEAAVEPDKVVNTLKQKYGYGKPTLHESYMNFAKEFLETVEAYEKTRITK
jgi:chromosome partitioning protein